MQRTQLLSELTFSSILANTSSLNSFIFLAAAITFKADILEQLKDQIKNGLAEVLKEEFRKREELELTVSVLQKHAHYYQN